MLLQPPTALKPSIGLNGYTAATTFARHPSAARSVAASSRTPPHEPPPVPHPLRPLAVACRAARLTSLALLHPLGVAVADPEDRVRQQPAKVLVLEVLRHS